MDWYWWSRRLGEDHARRWRQRDEDMPPRPRVLLESPDGAEAHAVWQLLSGHGYDTMWCPGPSGHPARECSLVRAGHCPLVERADVIVNALGHSDAKRAEVALRLDAGADPVAQARPVVVLAPRSAVAELSVSLPHCEVVPGPLRSQTLLRVVTRAAPSRTPEGARAAG